MTFTRKPAAEAPARTPFSFARPGAWLGLGVLSLTLAACGLTPTSAASATPPATPVVVVATASATLPPVSSPVPAATATPVSSATPAPTPTAASLFPPVSAADWQDGPVDALMTIVVYADFECPHCATLAPALRQLRQEFPTEVRLVYRHLPLINIHPKAVLAAEAAEAAGAQGRFWDMFDWLYAHQATWIQYDGPGFRTLLSQYATDLGLDVARFDTALDQATYNPKVEADFNAAVAIGIPAIPCILLNGSIYQGPIDHWALRDLVQLEELKARQFQGPPAQVIDPLESYTATLHTARGDVVVALFSELAPTTVNSFVFLAQHGWYDHVTFHRVSAGVAQTGDPSGTGYGGPGYFIPDEINPLFTFDGPGWVGMANAGPDSNGSQFFITRLALPEFNGRYTIFGRVISGMDVVNALHPRDPDNDPEAPPGDLLLGVTITSGPP